MTIQELEKLYLERQSVREFSPAPLARETVEEICRAALLAPSAMNAQPWRLIAVCGEKKKEIAKAVQRLGVNRFVSDAAAIVVVAEGKSGGLMKVGEIFKENEFVRNDLGILTAYLVLAAQAAGVGSCIIGWRDEDKLRGLLGLKEKVRIPLVVALGYPAEGYPVREKKRKPQDETFALI